MTTPMYFTHGKLLAQSGNIRVYLFNGLLHLEEDHNLWAIEDEIEEYRDQMGNKPKGNCLEIGLGLGIASKHILSFDNVKSLTTVEINKHVIKTQRTINPINDPRHHIINMDGVEYLRLTKDKYDFIFLDFYHFVDEDSIDMIKGCLDNCKRILKNGGHIVPWIDIYIPEEFIGLLNKLLND
jgi:SAM-dependent methyltransferase